MWLLGNAVKITSEWKLHEGVYWSMQGSSSSWAKVWVSKKESGADPFAKLILKPKTNKDISVSAGKWSVYTYSIASDGSGVYVQITPDTAHVVAPAAPTFSDRGDAGDIPDYVRERFKRAFADIPDAAAPIGDAVGALKDKLADAVLPDTEGLKDKLADAVLPDTEGLKDTLTKYLLIGGVLVAVFLLVKSALTTAVKEVV